MGRERERDTCHTIVMLFQGPPNTPMNQAPLSVLFSRCPPGAWPWS